MKGRILIARVAVAVLPLAGAAVAAADAAPAMPLERYLSVRAATNPVFAPSGGRVGFLTDITGIKQAWWTTTGGGWPEQITFGGDTVRQLTWSPADENVVVFVRDQGGDERGRIYLVNLSTGAERCLTPKDGVKNELGFFARDGKTLFYRSNERDPASFDVYALDLSGGEPRRVFQGAGSNSPEAVSPDGRSLIVSTEHGNLDADLRLVDLASGSEPVYLTPHTGDARYESIRFGRENDQFWLLSDAGRPFLNLARYDVTRKKLEFVESADNDLEGLAVSEDGRLLVTVSNKEGWSRLEIRDFARAAQRLPVEALPSGVISGLAISRSGRRIAFALSGPRQPYDVWIYDVGSAEFTRLTSAGTAGIPTARFVHAERRQFRSFDGTMIYGWLARAPGPEEPGPVIVLVHGGPESEARPDFSGLAQYLVSRGLTVYEPNVRGSTGSGRTFTHMDDGPRRLDAVRDLAECAKWLVSSGVAAPGRVAVMGQSYGGYMTLAGMAFHPDLWAAGVDIVGISSFKTFLANTAAYRRDLRAAEYGDPREDSAALDKASPLLSADRIRAPLLIIQGENDPRVPRSESEQIAAAVRARGIEVEYLLFPDEGHGLVKLANQLKGYGAAAAFLERHLLSAPAAPEAAPPKQP